MPPYKNYFYLRAFEKKCSQAILFVNNETKKIYNLEFFTQGVAGIIRKWIELDCITEVDEIVEIIKACVGFNPK